MSTIQVRIDPKIKKEANKILNKVGLDMSSAIKVYLSQIVISQGIPFPVLTENGLTIQQERAILKASEEAKRGINVSGPFEGEEAVNYLRSLANDAN